MIIGFTRIDQKEAVEKYANKLLEENYVGQSEEDIKNEIKQISEYFKEKEAL